MSAPAFSLSAIPPATLLALGQAFAIPEPEGTTANDHYDHALFNLMTFWGGQEKDENGVHRLALAMMHTARLMGGAAAPNREMAIALSQGAMFNATSAPKPAVEPVQPPAPQTQEPEQPAPPAPKMTGDGWLILDYEPGVHLSSEQARERAGIGKSAMAKLLQAGEFVRPMGVIVMKSGQRAKVYSAEDVDNWKLLRAKATGTKLPKEEGTGHNSPEAAAKRAASKLYIDALPEVDWSQVRYGLYWTTDQVAEELGVSRSHLYTLQNKGEFPKATHKSKDPHQSGGMKTVLYVADTVTQWIATSTEPTAFRARRKRAQAATTNGTAVDSPKPEPDGLGSPQLVGGGAAPANDALNGAAEKLATLGKVSLPGGKQWMTLRDVAEYLGESETTVERMVKDGKFPKAHRQDGRLHIREWGARQVAKWKREHQQAGALTK